MAELHRGRLMLRAREIAHDIGSALRKRGPSHEPLSEMQSKPQGKDNVDWKWAVPLLY